MTLTLRVSSAIRLAQGLVLATLLAWQMPAGADEASTLQRVPLEIHAGTERHRLEVELARSSSERQKGLMDRDHLAPDAGMLFLYEEQQPAAGSFWMYRTRIPLDIAFIDADGRIAALHTMQPCLSRNPYDCPVTVAGAAYHAALEVNAGYFEERGIEEGACVSWPGRQGDCPSTAQ
ncbi:DUF192 domain-containing protein [Halomonas sp. LR3S48]|uniref:DUF192 domain-containing protein n=1 Tax=Halomonas sp. LR3S48 TaxID=2982694 RepID=UPI0021E3AA7C|nr:DUF192 domain-containing protein [Halomonas sp. LR3S48]UYG02830.1 DUF192 domain-containing protein [Halomonas sp. LR3S48]